MATKQVSGPRGPKQGERPADPVRLHGVRELVVRQDKTTNFTLWIPEVQNYLYEKYPDVARAIVNGVEEKFEKPSVDATAERETAKEKVKMERQLKKLERIAEDLQRKLLSVKEGTEEHKEEEDPTEELTKQLDEVEGQILSIQTDIEILHRSDERIREAHKIEAKTTMEKAEKYKSAKITVYGVIWNSLTRDSWDLAAESKDFEDARTTRDPIQLFKVLRDTHLTQNGPVLSMTRNDKLREFTVAHQRNDESVTSWLERFRAIIEGMRAVGCTVPEKEEQSARFVDGLDRKRYGDLQYELRAQSLLSGSSASFPKDVESAVRLAQSYRPRPIRTSTAATNPTFVTSAKAEEAPKDKGKKGRQRPTDMSNEVCSKCKKKGHWWRECPTRDKATVAFTKGSVQLTYPVVTVNEIVFTAKGTKPSSTVILDIGATSSIVGNKDLLTDVRKANTQMKFDGINGHIFANEVGELGDYGTVWYSPKCPVNIISWSELDKNKPGTLFGYDNEKKKFELRFQDGTIHQFCLDAEGTGGLFTRDFNDKVVLYTKQETRLGLSAKDIDKAKIVRDFWQRLGPVGAESVKIAGRRSSKTIFAPRDVDNCVELFGRNPGCTLGGATEPPNVIDVGPRQIARRYQYVEMHSDIMQINKHYFLISRVAPIGIILNTHMGTSTKKVKEESEKFSITSQLLDEFLRGQIAGIVAEGFIVDTIIFDGQSGLKGLITPYAALGIKLKAKTGHVPRAEAAIKHVKKFIRGIIPTLGFKLPQILIPDIVEYAVNRINMLETKGGIPGYPPVEVFTGVPVDFDRDAKLKFGQYVLAVTPNLKFKNDVSQPRAEGGIIVGQRHRNGSVRVRLLKSRRVVERTKVEPMPMPPEVKQAIESWGEEAEEIVLDEDEPNVDDGVVGPEAFVPEPIISVQHQRPELLEVTDTEEPEATSAEEPVDGGEQINEAPVTMEEVEEVPAATEEVVAPAVPVQQVEEVGVRRSSRLRSKGAVDYSRLSSEGYAILAKAYNLTTRACKAKYGVEATNKAIQEELRQIHDKGVIVPVTYDALSVEEKRTIIPSHITMKGKLGTDGKLIKVKGRLVANGNLQDRNLYEDVSSPTASVTTLLTVVALAAKNGWKVGSADVTGAYLNAHMPTEGHRVRMVLNPEISDILSEVDGKYGDYKRRDGSLVVELKKALYGCVESAQLWYNEVSGFLKSIGLKASKADPCLFTGKDMHIVLFVDDLIVTAKNEKDIEDIFDKLAKKYGSVTRTISDVISYLGMVFDFRESGVVKVNMDAYVDSIIDGVSIDRVQESPAGVNIFTIDEDSELLDSTGQDIFHSTVAKLLYVAKRARPDILLPVSFLTTRVKKATIQDNNKLQRVLGYLKRGHKGLVLGAGADGVKLEAYIDASHATHADFKGHSGVVVTLGRGPIYVSSTKQKAMSKSSFEAEIYAASDGGSMVIWILKLLEDLGANVKPAIIYQDNEGAASVLRSGKLSGKGSKHINIDALWVHEEIVSGNVDVKWIPTTDMWADIVTKGVVGEDFLKQRSRLLGA